MQYFEQMGHRGLWADGWKVTTYHQAGQPFDDDEWALYHLDQDFSECHDLAATHPGKLRELIDAWWIEAGQHGVLPLDDRTIELFGGTPRPGTVHARPDYVYYPPISHLPADASPRLGGRPWLIAVDVVVPAEGAEGVLYARGSSNAGHSFFMSGGALHFDYNTLGTHYRASAPLTLRAGQHELVARFERTGPGGTVTIGADSADLASVDIPTVMRIIGSTGVDIGRDALSPVADDYEAPFPFSGQIEKITFRLGGQADIADVAATARTELARE
jgi:hypothetical protein